MKNSTAAIAAIAAPLLLGGCTLFGAFEDIGSDPHPPTMRIERVSVTPPSAAQKASRADTFETNGLTVLPGTKLSVLLSYTDAGGDLKSFRFRDRDGSLDLAGVPGTPKIDTDGDGVPDTDLEQPEYFAGTAGVAFFDDIEITAKQAGPHRIEVWAVDGHESRSEKTEFVVTVAFQ